MTKPKTSHTAQYARLPPCPSALALATATTAAASASAATTVRLGRRAAGLERRHQLGQQRLRLGERRGLGLREQPRRAAPLLPQAGGAARGEGGGHVMPPGGIWRVPGLEGVLDREAVRRAAVCGGARPARGKWQQEAIGCRLAACAHREGEGRALLIVRGAHILEVATQQRRQRRRRCLQRARRERGARLAHLRAEAHVEPVAHVLAPRPRRGHEARRAEVRQEGRRDAGLQGVW
eukprot:scaffold15725_cov57-Phaeocystis_antarctica.AAC.2